MRIEADLPYARTGGHDLCLDLYYPESGAREGEGPERNGVVPVILYLHGGGWARGDKRDFVEARLHKVVERGIAVASANYRLLPDDLHPAQIHDAKAAVRWLRANGAARGLETSRIGAWGASAGGYLATMLGLTAGDSDLEGDLGPHCGVSSAVQAVVTWFAPFDLVGTSRRSWLERQAASRVYAPALFGREEIERGDAIIDAADPCRRVHAAAPPFLIAHGDSDRIVPMSESLQMHNALARENVDATLCLIAAAGHEDDRFHSRSNLAMTAAWIKAMLSRS
ncbi:alpha/beta hydrolase [Sphingomonas oligophenolica]|uniref:Alpha/beta hydrolase n=1 Tax=Sphingomonas oligophenolica TaxID=301154 RepID=A0ABU9YBM3_9SPHN